MRLSHSPTLLERKRSSASQSSALWTSPGRSLPARQSPSRLNRVPGLYTIPVELTGFRKFTRENVQVRVNDRVELDIGMQVVDKRCIAELPLFADNATDLVHPAPGTVNGTDMGLPRPPSTTPRRSSPPAAAAITATSLPLTQSPTSTPTVPPAPVR